MGKIEWFAGYPRDREVWRGPDEKELIEKPAEPTDESFSKKALQSSDLRSGLISKASTRQKNK